MAEGFERMINALGIDVEVSNPRYIDPRDTPDPDDQWPRVESDVTLRRGEAVVFRTTFSQGIACLSEEAQGRTVHAHELRRRFGQRRGTNGWKAPTAADVVHALVMDAEPILSGGVLDAAELAEHYGWNDVRKVLEAWDSCLKTAQCLRRHFTVGELDTLISEALDY